MPDSPSGDDLDAAQAGGDASGQEAAPAPFGGMRPWWSVDMGDGTGPHALVNGTGPQPLPRNGTGPHPMPGSVNGSGSHPVVGGTGPHGVLRDGSGAHPVVRNGTGPLPPVTGAPAGSRRMPKLLLVAGAAAVAGMVLVAGVLAWRTGGARKAAETAAGPAASDKVINAGPTAGGLRKDPLTAPQASAAYPFVAGALEAGGVPVAKSGLAVYTEEPVRRVSLLFAGGTGRIGDPADFLQKTQPTTFIAGQDADPGRKGGKAVCGTFAVLAETHTYCAWATRDSFGVVASNRPTVNPQFPLMADLMHRIRKDVEKPK
ncbi:MULTISPECIES: hypothetical protein [unclassified Actinomadura]|uniref:hypothetical protein n=1 Tax=unclassified Actinomadura TaxID=2626254 RepID=UPI0011F081DD|nr:hypothetical protein [Actinomadura sp. K4S16]